MDTLSKMMNEYCRNRQSIPEERYKFKIGDLVAYTFPNNESITGKIISIDRSTTFVPYVVSFGKNPAKIGFYFWEINRKVNYSMPFIDSIKDSYDGEWCAILREDELSLVERIEDNMVTMEDIKEATKKLQDMVDEFKKSPKDKKENDGFMFKTGDLVEFKSNKGLVCGIVISQYFKSTFAGSSEHIVYLPNDYRGFGFQGLPTSIKENLRRWEDRCGTFVYAEEQDLNRIYRICEGE